MLPINFKLFTSFAFIIFIILYFVFHNALATLIILSIITAQFPDQGKYYTFQLIEPHRILIEPFFSQGIIEGFGISASDIFVFAIVLFLIKILMETLFFSSRQRLVKQFRNNTLITITVGSWFVYIAFSLFSSVSFSPNPAYSVINLFGYAKFLILALATYMVLRQQKKPHHAFLPLLKGTTLFQALIGLWQVVQGFTSLNANTKSGLLPYLPEENTLLVRPIGTFAYANQYAFILLLFTLLFIAMSKNRKNNSVIFFSSFVCILFSQSRTIWLALTSIGGFTYLLYHRKIWRLVKHNISPGITIRLLGIFLSIFLVVVIPRLVSLQFSFSGGSVGIRQQMIEEGFFTLLQRPLTGFGIETNVTTIFQFFPKGYVLLFPFAVHMAYLQMALESGIIATICFFFPFIYLLRRTLVHILHHSWRRIDIVSFFVMTTIATYYTFQPHGGRNEFIFLGFIFGFFM